MLPPESERGKQKEGGTGRSPSSFTRLACGHLKTLIRCRLFLKGRWQRQRAGDVGQRVTGLRFNGCLRQGERGSSPSLVFFFFSVFVFVFCFSLQQLGMESRARSSESLLNLDSYLPRFHRPLYGKYVGPGKVSLEADYLILCGPPASPGGGEILKGASSLFGRPTG